ncbi:aminopeptidase P family protein [Lachnotalea sp. AF33-28]|jgi:Xaa-Pro aminopeptidase|uniref:aminopeptidase P family protein n=1 Tax=Lachnotalea sp. AF33-28 TaxID=2292046 RepID=UPI000E470D36|nr:aminopeptidase P family protein [Lachnotalea sp. AF33-28]RHP32445.1 aminopeptidase P family protein [Lachnotalea sp. AF33-28]
MVQENLNRLRALMSEKQVDAYMVPTSDYHESEYVGGYFKTRAWMTGFTGSAGTLIVSQQEAGLWTDGRYFIQAETQLKGSGITLYRMGNEGVPTVFEFLENTVPEGGCLGFDGRVVNAALGKGLEDAMKKKGARIAWEEDLCGQIWTDRPALSAEKAYLLKEEYTGCSMADKLAGLRMAMKEKGADIHLNTCLDDIAWLFNMRGNDIPYNPVVLSYAAVTMTEAVLFVQDGVLGEDIARELEKNCVTVRPYEAVYDYVKQIPETCRVLLDKSRTNYAICSGISSAVKILDEKSPVMLAKAVKNPVEVDNERNAHKKDGVAVTKFIYWLKQNIGKTEITEISASDYLEELRRQQENFVELSFDTIAAYKDNAAMCHYSATPESSRTLKPEGFLLVDSGGQYLEGTTDITRTIALGALTKEEIRSFTLVLKGMIRLAKAKFLYGCRGLNLDYLARGPLWEHGMDYNHGTGHGVGYMLNVHEAPNGFRWKVVPERDDSCILEEGMITSNEPGYYEAGQYGIRTENLIVCKKAEKNEYGQFMEFETLTLAPIDRDAIDVSLLDEEELEWLNDYHRRVYEELSPCLDAAEAAWLKEATEKL